nr:hypothetical protein CFP56_31706 [Quercus suber]
MNSLCTTFTASIACQECACRHQSSKIFFPRDACGYSQSFSTYIFTTDETLSLDVGRTLHRRNRNNGLSSKFLDNMKQVHDRLLLSYRSPCASTLVLLTVPQMPPTTSLPPSPSPLNSAHRLEQEVLNSQPPMTAFHSNLPLHDQRDPTRLCAETSGAPYSRHPPHLAPLPPLPDPHPGSAATAFFLDRSPSPLNPPSPRSNFLAESFPPGAEPSSSNPPRSPRVPPVHPLPAFRPRLPHLPSP